MRCAILVHALWFSSLAYADIDPEAATAQLHGRFQREWQDLIDALKWSGWRIQYRGTTYSGDLAVHLSGWRYFFDRGRLRCSIQTDEYMFCDNGASVAPQWTASEVSPGMSVERLIQLRRALGYPPLAIATTRDSGRAIVETVVSTRDAPSRTSRRYRAELTLTDKGFALGPPQRVEEYAETCVAVNGSESTHWTCRR